MKFKICFTETCDFEDDSYRHLESIFYVCYRAYICTDSPQLVADGLNMLDLAPIGYGVVSLLPWEG